MHHNQNYMLTEKNQNPVPVKKLFQQFAIPAAGDIRGLRSNIAEIFVKDCNIELEFQGFCKEFLLEFPNLSHYLYITEKSVRAAYNAFNSLYGGDIRLTLQNKRYLEGEDLPKTIHMTETFYFTLEGKQKVLTAETEFTNIEYLLIVKKLYWGFSPINKFLFIDLTSRGYPSGSSTILEDRIFAVRPVIYNELVKKFARAVTAKDKTLKEIHAEITIDNLK